MITNLFRKSTPINYALILILLIGFYFTYQFSIHQWSVSNINTIELFGNFFIIIGTFFISNFIIKKNELSKDSSYTILFYFLFLIALPSVFNKSELLFSNLLIALALRRLVSMQSLKFTKEKIFDASILILIAAVLQFWSILFMVLVFISILFYVARDYRNWVIPIIAFIGISILFGVSTLLITDEYYQYLIENAFINLEFEYLEFSVINFAFGYLATIFLFFVLSILFTLSQRPIILHSTYRLIISAIIIGSGIYIFSMQKQPELILFIFTPLSILATSHIEFVSNKWHQEILLWTITLISVCSFFIQL